MAKKPLLIVGGALFVVLVAVLSIAITVMVMGQRQYTSILDQQIEYATDSVIILSEDDAALQVTDDEDWHSIWLSYSPKFYSANGRDFNGVLANSAANDGDMFIAIYADPQCSDRVFTSKLLRPGTKFEGFRLDRRMDPGDFDLYLAFTLVNTVDGIQTIVGQQVVAAEFHVSG